jgi:hypothetical protein
VATLAKYDPETHPARNMAKYGHSARNVAFVNDEVRNVLP